MGIVTEAPEETLKEQWEADKRIRRAAATLKPGDFFELNGVCYEVTKISHKGTLFCKPFSGSLVVPRNCATATQLKGARRA